MSGKKGRSGRPSKYTPELAQEILERLEDGETLRSICRDDHMPDEKTVRTWGDEKDEFSPHYARARDQGVDSRAQEILAIVRDPDIDVQRAKLIADTDKWYVSKLAPKRYGDKAELNLEGDIQITIKQ